MTQRETTTGPTAVVLAGAGARGAYETGLLAGLLPALEEQGRRPTLFVGTSAGAINAALFASLAHEPAADAAAIAVERWRAITRRQVIGPAGPSVVRAGLNYLGAVTFGRPQVTAVLDNEPLQRTLSESTLLDWVQLHANIRSGAVDGLALVTTEHGSRHTKVFYESAPGRTRPPTNDSSRAIDYVATPLTADHVVASAAIPGAFPPVRLEVAPGVETWHMDGGVRLNAPLKPAIELGASRLVVIATSPCEYPDDPPVTTERPPALQDAIDQVLEGALSDRMVEDVLALDRTNRLVEGGARGVSTRSGTRTYESVPYVFGGPENADELGEVSARALARTLGGARALTHPDLAALSFLLRSGPASRPDLVSYLFFEPEFLSEALELGQQRAAALLAQGPLWQGEPA